MVPVDARRGLIPVRPDSGTAKSYPVFGSGAAQQTLAPIRIA
jgi:hypothetical protein